MSEDATTPTPTSSRRRFLATSAGVGAGVWAAPAVLSSAQAAAAVSDVPPPVCTPSVLFFDDFDQENPPNNRAVLNFNNFTNWVVSDGRVDLIGNGEYDLVPGNGLYVDLDGSMLNGGKITSKQAFEFKAGCRYELRYRLSGNARPGRGTPTDTVHVRVDGGMPFAEHVLNENDAPADFVLAFSPPADTTSTISFEDLGADNIGVLLFQVELVCL